MSARRWIRHEIAPGRAGPLFRAAGFAMVPGDPVAAHGHRDRAGHWRRLHACYEGGWRVTLVLHADGTASLSYAIRLKGVIGGSARP